MNHKVIKVTNMRDQKLLVAFDDGAVKVYNAAAVAENNIDLQIPTLWNSIKVSKDGTAVRWINSVSLSADELYAGGVDA